MLLSEDNLGHYRAEDSLTWPGVPVFRCPGAHNNTFHIVCGGYTQTSTSNPFLCAADFFLQLGSCKEAVIDGNRETLIFRPGLVKKCRGPRFPRAFLTRPFRIIWAKTGKNKQISTVL